MARRMEVAAELPVIWLEEPKPRSKLVVGLMVLLLLGVVDLWVDWLWV